MKKFFAKIQSEQSSLPKSFIRSIVVEVLKREGEIEKEEDLEPNCCVTLDKKGLQDDGLFHVDLTIEIPEEEDNIDKFLSLIEGADIGEEKKIL